MSSWKVMKSVAQSFSHHMQSFFGYIVPHVAEELSKTNDKQVKIVILPKIIIPDNLISNNHLIMAVESSKNWFSENLKKQNIKIDIVKSLNIEISLYDYISMDSSISTIIETADGKEIIAKVDYIRDSGKSKIQIRYINTNRKKRLINC